MEARDQWRSRAGFILSTVGAAVGLGNFWRFPFMAYENGGGAFLLPYFVALLTAGVPLMILEFGYGHKMRAAAISAFGRLSRKWEWIGWWQVMIPVVVVTYYSVIIGWALNYMIYSFTQAWGADPGAFFSRQFLGVSAGPWDFQGIRWHLLVATAVIWWVNYYYSIKGISAGIEAACRWMTPTLGILMVIIAIRGLTLPGAAHGLNFFL
ncbi:hypothetical protein [Thermaerobacter subterraneus]|uniref:hypothetical protein n=1 Tax=Thermaerobacter subterraneus TaxID=175696 RepID=UPI0001EB4F28|nr:hypothetical protein [Thermaerobacter subterraneus]